MLIAAVEGLVRVVPVAVVVLVVVVVVFGDKVTGQ